LPLSYAIFRFRLLADVIDYFSILYFRAARDATPRVFAIIDITLSLIIFFHASMPIFYPCAIISFDAAIAAARCCRHFAMLAIFHYAACRHFLLVIYAIIARLFSPAISLPDDAV
jgi:hypothetical protein